MMQRPPRSPLSPYTTLFRSPISVQTFMEPERLQAKLTVSTCPAGRRQRYCTGRRRFPSSKDLHVRSSGTATQDRKSTRLNSSHLVISYAVFCLKKKKRKDIK